jgi:hypothetical protein
MALDRGEPDYFMGSMTMNLVLSELIFAAVFVGVLLFQWPTPNWDVIQYAMPAGVALAPVALFPISRLVWFGVDLALRPGNRLS